VHDAAEAAWWSLIALGDPVSPNGRRLAYSGNDRIPSAQDILVQDRETGGGARV
jgi:hypothetical protein